MLFSSQKRPNTICWIPRFRGNGNFMPSVTIMFIKYGTILSFMRKNYQPQENETHVYRAGCDHPCGLPLCIDLRLRILESEDRVDLSRRIYACTLPDMLLVGTIAGFDVFETLSAEKGFLVILCLGLLAELSQYSHYIIHMIVSKSIKWRFSQY